MDLFKHFFFDQISKMRKIFTKTSFSQQSEPNTAKLGYSVVLKNFGGNSLSNYLYRQKCDYFRKSTEIPRKFVELKFEMGKILRKIWICINKIF